MNSSSSGTELDLTGHRRKDLSVPGFMKSRVRTSQGRREDTIENEGQVTPY